MLKRISRERLLLFVSVLPFALTFAGPPTIFLGHSDDDNIPHSMQLLTLLQQEALDPQEKIAVARHFDRSQLRDTKDGRWGAGLTAFRDDKMRLAAENFVAVLDNNDKLSSPDRAAVAFWAYRSFAALGDSASADIYLNRAANEKTGFYSMIARQLGGKEPTDASKKETVASLYPMPKWTPSSGYQVEPALLFAIMREESQFNPQAQSAKGAMGVMQLMPSTAQAMARHINIAGSSAEPAVSMALGQQYIKQLMEQPLIQNNMVYVLAAYNAGPAMVQKWHDSGKYNNDPLLFVESIPFAGTRDYVVNVMGNYWVYAGLFGGDANASIVEMAHGTWPHYAGPVKQAVAARN